MTIYCFEMWQPFSDEREPEVNASRLPIFLRAASVEEAWAKVQKLGYERSDLAEYPVEYPGDDLRDAAIAYEEEHR